jgi:hypothetical protein
LKTLDSQQAQEVLKQVKSNYSTVNDSKRHIVYIHGLDPYHLKQTMTLLGRFEDAYVNTLGALAGAPGRDSRRPGHGSPRQRDATGGFYLQLFHAC